ITPRIVSLTSELVAKEMDTFSKSASVSGTAFLTPQYIDNWKVEGIRDTAPIMSELLTSAAQTRRAAKDNTKKKPDRILNSVLCQLSYSRTNRSLEYQTMYGVFLWCTGCQEQTIEALHQCGMSVSYSTVRTAVTSLGAQCLLLAVFISAFMHVFCYDNVNLATSRHVEQRGSNTPDKVQSGTFAVLYSCRNGNPMHMLLLPILHRLAHAPPFDFARDLRPTPDQSQHFHSQLVVHISNILFDYSTGFSPEFRDHETFRHTNRRRLPPGYITQQYPIPASRIEEATVKGNIRFHDYVYESDAMIYRHGDINEWERRKIFQLGFGLFHACQTLLWCILVIHRGTLHQTGSLTYFFEVMEKTRLGGAKPDYYALLHALTQILEGLIINAWRQECGFPDLESFAASKPTREDIRALSERILNKYAVPLEEP
ncbi:hypothetical protein BDZ89DRAFT_936606, partial [Hymenopellis radicata]